MRSLREEVLLDPGDTVSSRHLFCGLAHDLPGAPLGDLWAPGHQLTQGHKLSQDPHRVSRLKGFTKGIGGEGMDPLLGQLHLSI